MDRYIKKFQTGNDIQDALDNLELLKPYTAYVVEGDYIDWNTKMRDYSKEYLTFVALEDTQYSFASALQYSLQYSTDNGNSWNTLSATQNTPTIQSGNKVLWKGNIYGTQSNYGVIFSSTGRYSIEGNIMSLRYGDNFRNQVILSEPYIFRNIFNDNIKLISAENLVLPATTLANNCYSFMFYNCTGLTKAPAILPATTLANNCYYYMFQGCTSLVQVPTLPATTLAQYCYRYMFTGCRSLTTAPELPATILTNFCYENMFAGCTSLNYIKCLATDISATNCTSNWVTAVSSTGTFVKNSNITSWTTGNDGIPTGWTVQDA